MRMVLKFGGTSLDGPERLAHVSQIIARAAGEGHQVAVVVSAQGKTTDTLLAQARAVSPEPDPRELDAILATGEQLSAGLLALALQEKGLPAVSLTGWQAGIRTDSTHGNARIHCTDRDRIRALLEAGKLPVVTGFQGVDESDDITTLGRGGSDTTAVALAVFLRAEKCRIYTDVDGVFDRDPRRYPDAVQYDRISYPEMLRLIRAGAQVLHDRSVELAQRFGLELEVLSAFSDRPGTLVCGDGMLHSIPPLD